MTAAKAGADGNVGAGRDPRRAGPLQPQPRPGHEPGCDEAAARARSSRAVKQEDVDAADRAAQERRSGAVRERARRTRTTVPEGTTVFPETAVMGDARDRRGPGDRSSARRSTTFTLSLTGDRDGPGRRCDADRGDRRGAARHVDQRRLRARAGLDQRGRGGGDASSTASSRSRSTATAKQVQPLDAAALERMVLGLPKAEAEAALAPYGDVVIVLWPGYVTNVPTMDAGSRRGQRRRRPGPAEATPSPSPTPTPRRRVAARDGSESPFATSFPLEESPSDTVPSEPVPSG